MRASARVFAVVFVFFMIASIGATAEQHKIGRPIYGFYLGESKQSLIQRARQEGIAYSLKGNLPDQLFPESFVFNSSLDRSELVKYALVSFYKDYVGQVSIYLNGNSEKQFMQAAQGLDQSWSSFPGYSAQTFGPIYIITLPEVLVTLVKVRTETHIEYVHRGMLRTLNEERNRAGVKE